MTMFDHQNTLVNLVKYCNILGVFLFEIMMCNLNDHV